MADTIKLFGRSYNQIGSSNADMLIKTKGQLKLQYGSKFIDLIKDGKLNVNSEFIFKVNALQDITGNNGIYICNDGSVYLKVGDSVINLLGEVGTTYVSFLQKQETTPEHKHQALINIGFLHESLDSIDETSLQNGIVYVESEQKLYTIVDGTVAELTVNFPNPFTSQFIVAKSNSNKGAILIKGTGVENSLAFESLFIYVDDTITSFDSDNDIIYSVGGKQVLSLSKLEALFGIDVVGNMFQSPGASGQTGFRLYIDNGKSCLEVDKLIVRGGDDDSSSVHLFPEYWLLRNNIISTAQYESEDSQKILSVQLTQDNEFVTGDILAFYKKSTRSISIGMVEVDVYDDKGNKTGTEEEEQFKEIESYSRVECELTDIQGNILTLECNDDISEDEVSALQQQFIYLIKSKSGELPIRIKDNNIDIVEYSDKDGDGNRTVGVKTRIGNLSDLDCKVLENGTEKKVDGYGLYSGQAIFELVQMLSTVTLPDTENSSTLAPTYWVQNLIKNIIPSGTIVAYNGTDEPAGWKICDGNNGTPDLRNKFIKGGDSSSASTVSGILIDEEDPDSISLDCYSLVFIMKV